MNSALRLLNRPYPAEKRPTSQKVKCDCWPIRWAGWYGSRRRYPGAVHDVGAARTVGLIDALTGAGGTICTPFKRHRHRPWLSRSQGDVNHAHARIRAIAERAVATLELEGAHQAALPPASSDRTRAASLVLQLIEEGRYSG